MTDCKWMQDELCVNADCPMRADFCPVAYVPGVCRFEEREGNNGEYIDRWTVVNRLIELENEFQQYKPFHGFEHAMYRKICEAEIAIGKTQAADVATVRHGRWIQCKYMDKSAQCSECGGYYTRFSVNERYPNYCPNCGCKMDLEG